MSDSNRENSIGFYFSFRSPYAWLAAERLECELGGLGVPLALFPICPTAEVFPNDAAAVPEKVAYIVQDILRLTREHGLTVRFPSPPIWTGRSRMRRFCTRNARAWGMGGHVEVRMTGDGAFRPARLNDSVMRSLPRQHGSVPKENR